MVKPSKETANKLPGLKMLKKQKFGRILIFLGVNTSYILTYYLINLYFPFIPNYPFYFALIASSLYLGGFRFGFFSLGVSSLAMVIIQPDNIPVLPLLASEGLIVVYFFEKIRNSSIINKLEEREQLLTKKYEENEQLLKSAQKEIRFRDEFLSIASHELKTPLTSMLLELQLMLHNVRNVSLAKFSVQNLMTMLESAEDQTKRLSKMINDLLNVSLITSGKLTLEAEEVSLNQIVEEAVNKITTIKGGTDIQFMNGVPVKGYWDKVRLEQVVVNFLSNAVKYGNGKPIKISVNKKDNFALLIIEDKGIGIARDKMGKIFERFKRGVTDKEYKGLGVGLYIVSQIVKQHGGKINVQSKIGKGTIFTVELPLNIKRREK
ncbi:MAG: sensory box histidine kinase [Candidatus Gottesmanbacteria bacterium GW2011_GWA2_43_14]|uniref:histidine kinase n=1 Tax=Candidatus Gottesmanbacteria bacterium GW2011_GWA2_43_14 TaxID=1618443 RepID=A0A0G1DJU9_9BACT|nr:MAG: sensory box histidine kinase [Candidatus Gottesmanbacteria bacterium GW2011_GWA2_43_14]